ncbi:MAG: single-stranded DNA-binding protein [Clostridia bacterium]|nr:single-stranded DNA-binding protein [Clostridia bacterium]
MNSVNLIGRFTRDPELRSTETGTSVCSFSLAVQRSFKNNDGEYEADFINCVAWKNSAEFISKYFKKGQQIGVQGELQTRKWSDDEGKTRYATEVIVRNTTFVGKSENNSSASGTSSDSAPDLPMPDLSGVSDEDLPF